MRKLQDRLPKELAQARTTTLEAANRWIAAHYLAAHNTRFAVASAQTGSAFVPDRAGAWRDILCIQADRQVGNDNTIRWRQRVRQIPPSPLRPHFVRAMVRVREYPDGALAIHLAPHRLADYDPGGNLRTPPIVQGAKAAAPTIARGRHAGPARPPKSGQLTRDENRSA